MILFVQEDLKEIKDKTDQFILRIRFIECKSYMYLKECYN